MNRSMNQQNDVCPTKTWIRADAEFLLGAWIILLVLSCSNSYVGVVCFNGCFT